MEKPVQSKNDKEKEKEKEKEKKVLFKVDAKKQRDLDDMWGKVKEHPELR